MRAHRWQPLSTMMLCGLILLYTLPAEPIVLGVVVLACLVVWWVVRRISSPASGKSDISKFKQIALSSVLLLVLLGVLYDIALVAGPQNSFIAALEDKFSAVPFLHFAERYRAGAVLMNEPLPNLAGLCLSIIAIVSLATGVGFLALDNSMIISPGPRMGAVRKRKFFIALFWVTTLFVFLNLFFGGWNFSTSEGSKSFIFKMRHMPAPFFWSASLLFISSFGMLVVRDLEFIYQLRKRQP